MILLKKFFILCFLAIVPLTAADKWMEYESKESGFSVDLPKLPDHVVQSIDIPQTDLSIKYNTYVAEPSDSIVYVISVWNYPEQIDMSKPEINLTDGFSGMLSALPNAKVLEKNVESFNGFKALEFKVKSDDIFFQGKLILVYNTLYQVFTVYKEKESEEMDDNYKHFIRSFELLNPEQHKAGKKLDL